MRIFAIPSKIVRFSVRINSGVNKRKRVRLLDLFPDMAPEQHDHFGRIFEACATKEFTDVPVNLSHVAFMKIFCDSYLMTHRALEHSSGVRLNPYLMPNCGFQRQEPEWLSTDVEPFGKKRSNIIGQVADYVSASASVFTPATDELSGGDSPARRWGASNALCDSHAFDEGDRQQLERLEDQRDEVVGQTMRSLYSAGAG